MPQPVFEKVNFCIEKEKIVEVIKAECKTDLLTDGVKKILSVCPRVFGVKEEVKDLTVKYNGKIVFYLFYVDSEGDIKKLECVNEFLGSLKLTEDFENSTVKVCVTPMGGECDLSGINTLLSASLKVEVSGCENLSCQALISGEDLIAKTCEVCSLKSFGVKGGAYPIEEQFEINYPILEVLSQKAELVVSSAQSGVGAVIVDGDIYLSALLLQKNEKRDIIREEKRLPFRIEIEHEDALPSALATAEVSLKSLSSDIQVDEEEKKSLVKISVILDMKGEVLLLEEKTVVEDVFSPKMNVSVDRAEHSFYSPEKINVIDASVKGRAGIEELPNGATILGVGGERVEIVTFSLKEQSVVVEGVLSMSVYLKDGDGGLYSYRLETSFENKLELDNIDFDNFKIEGACYSPTAKIISKEEIELEGKIAFTVKMRKKQTVRVINGVTEGEEKEINDSAISVYIPMENETLWSLSKRLGVCPNDLLETNKDLQFPLTGKERIVVYRQK